MSHLSLSSSLLIGRLGLALGLLRLLGRGLHLGLGLVEDVAGGVPKLLLLLNTKDGWLSRKNKMSPTAYNFFAT